MRQVSSTQAPAEVYATLLDQGIYHCSIRTMYRILEQARPKWRETPRSAAPPPSIRSPSCWRKGPNQVWSWDITKLMGPAKWTYFYLYVILDIFSRRVVGLVRGPMRKSAGPVQAIAR